MIKKIFPYLFYIAWLQALAAMLGSLFFSEIWKLPPCSLCWYQRIFMYPLAFIIPLGVIKKDKHLPMYVLSLAIPGSIIALYHNLLYYRIIPENAAPCSIGISCTTEYISWLGFITIPLLSLAAFVIVITSMIIYLKYKKLYKVKS